MNGRGVNKTVSTMLKVAVVAPIPSARIPTTATVNPGAFSSDRRAYRMSEDNPFIAS